MKALPLFLVLVLVLCLCASNWPRRFSNLYNPAAEPLTADELASLLNVYHWKITQTPNDGKPYWGVRIVTANHGSTFQPTSPPPPPYEMLDTVAILPFYSPIASNENPQILLGMRIEGGKFTGRLSITTPGKGTDSTEFHIDHISDEARKSQMDTCSGTVWKDNRVDLVDYRDSHFQPTGAICLEFLHSAPQ